jgi:hypothetical protein
MQQPGESIDNVDRERSGMPPRGRRAATSQDVTDISSVDQLLRYAIAAQLVPLEGQRYTHQEIAAGAGLGSTDRTAGPVLAKALNGSDKDSERLTFRQLQGLDQIIGALTLNRAGGGGLSSLALRLGPEPRGWARGSSLEANIPPSWTSTVLTDPPVGEVGVLMQASALVSEFMAAGKMDEPRAVAAISDRYSQEIDLLVRRLILVSSAPPASRSYAAQVLLGMLTAYAFEQVKDRLQVTLRDRPMGFRVWPAITKLVGLSSDRDRTDAVRVWVQRLIVESGKSREKHLYPGNSYDLELALAIPVAWSPPGNDWVGDALRARAWDNEATIRERGTAAMGLWQRAISQNRSDLENAEDDLRGLITEFKQNPIGLPSTAAGFRWLAATLEHVIKNRVDVCNDWPDVGEPWFGRVQAAADRLDGFGIPDHLRTGTRNLFLHMILQNAGVYRRWAIETVVTGGMSQPVIQALSSLLSAETSEAWLRIRVQAALGLMQRYDPAQQADLTEACLQACQNLGDDQMPTRSQVVEMHAALFAVGDCFGSADVEERAGRARDSLRPILLRLADARGDRARILQQAARAAAYLLAVTAQPGRRDFSQELLQKLTGYPDPVTSDFSSWVLSFRFTDDGRVRPLTAAAELERPGGLA